MASGKPAVEADPACDRVAISGATLSQIMQAFSSSEGDCDGILFGHVQRQTSSTLGDDEVVGAQSECEEFTASVTGHCCTGRVMSFYDATGQIDPSKLFQMIGEREDRGGDSPIGWFVGRRETTMRPSMRETSVTINLRMATHYLPPCNASGGMATIEGSGPGNVSKETNRLPSKTRGTEGVGIVDATGIPNLGKGPMQTRISLSRDGGVTSSSANAKVVGNFPSRESSSGSGSGGIVSPGGFVHTKVPGSSVKGSSSGISHEGGLILKLVGVPSTSPCVFLLISEYAINSTYTHEYRAFQYRDKAQGGGIFEPRTLNIVNIGPAFRALYDSFSPVAPFPWFLNPSDMEGTEGTETTGEGLRRAHGKDALSDVSVEGGGRPGVTEQALLNMYSQDFSVDRLRGMIRTEGKGGHVRELEDLYTKMLMKLEALAKQVCESSDALAEQENANVKLRAAIMGTEHG